MDDISELDKLKANLKVQDNCWKNHKEYDKRNLKLVVDSRLLKKSRNKNENRQEDR